MLRALVKINSLPTLPAGTTGNYQTIASRCTKHYKTGQARASWLAY